MRGGGSRDTTRSCSSPSRQSALAAGGMLQLAAAGGTGDAAWIAAGLCGAGYSLWSIADSIRHGRLGVDVIALLALGGALAVGDTWLPR